MFDDNSIMPFGAHQGKKMANVPAKALLWHYDNFRSWNADQLEVKKYIEENLDALKSENKRTN